MGAAIWTARDASDARAYLSLSLYAVRELRAVREAPSHFGRHVVFAVERCVVLDGPEGPAS